MLYGPWDFSASGAPPPLPMLALHNLSRVVVVPAGLHQYDNEPLVGSGAPGRGAPGSGAPGSGAPGRGAPGSVAPGSSPDVWRQTTNLNVFICF